jgi:hypothetical protein
MGLWVVGRMIIGLIVRPCKGIWKQLRSDYQYHDPPGEEGHGEDGDVKAGVAKIVPHGSQETGHLEHGFVNNAQAIEPCADSCQHSG